MYKPVDPKIDFPKMEEGVLAFWTKHDTFKKSISQREDAPEYVFYDGPPFATGLPHFGHFVPGTIKDVIPRYKTMKGMKVERRFGWDCHGLPVEYEMEKELGISGKREIEEYGIAKFNEACRSIVLRYTKEWRTIMTRAGRWVDFDHDYKTMDLGYMESIWWVISQLWKKKLVYEGYKILPYCPRCSTALSNFELNLGGYKDIHDPAITVRFKVKGQENTFILAWTTTPWTLPSNLALAFGADVTYVEVKDGNDLYILAEDRLEAYYKKESDYSLVKKFKGKEFAGVSYEPLFPYFADLAAKGAFKTTLGDFVTTEDGTGIVHIAPGFGEDDYNVMKDSGLPTVCPVDAECAFTPEVSAYKGMFVKSADKKIIDDLKASGKLVKRDTYLHSYPHCWRCKSPLVYRAISSWFVDVEKLKPKMLAANEEIYWMPEHLKHGRFGKWLENARDWAISRNRYWGNPLPIWKCDSCKSTECIGSREELENKTGKKITDLHKHFIDDLTWRCNANTAEGGVCSGTMKRIPEVLDCWFESGSMPYAQLHYPFEHKDFFEAHFPSDFIAEAQDQTRGWFYTLTVLSSALFDRPAFKNVVVNGMVLAADGKKMSKSERNYTDPSVVMNTYGADALRLFLLHSAVLKAEDLRYSDDGVKEELKNVIIPLWNSYSFFITYANIDKLAPLSAPAKPSNPLDRWILSEVERMVGSVTRELDRYDLQKAVDFFITFIDLLNNWYIRRSRRRFWRSENDSDKKEAYETLFCVLMKVVLVASPFIPFVTEEIYQNIKPAGSPDSVHLCTFPVADESRRDLGLEKEMDTVRRAITMGRSLRSMFSLKNRQPLGSVHLVTRDSEERAILEKMQELVAEELNVKKVVFRENEEDLVTYSIKANFKVLGKVLGKDMKEAAQIIEKMKPADISAVANGKTVPVTVAGKTISLDQESLIIQRTEKENLKVANDGSLTVALDPTLSEELVQEGLVRDLVRGIQNMRKNRGLQVTDRISLILHGDPQVKEAVENFSEYLSRETLAVAWEWKKDHGQEALECGEGSCLCGLSVSIGGKK
ncbi:MAG: isoleucine--tRNA ligase [Spirochaetaceae bacterium]|nr:MAG: isoleucine--tRNA ligase [Spirochaetaceae bacterium]